MNIYLVSQTKNKEPDAIVCFVIIAPDEDTARDSSPNGRKIDWKVEEKIPPHWSSWVTYREDVKVELIGISASNEVRVVCRNFNE